MPRISKEKLSIFYWYHSFIKWVLHIITGRCELERICHNIKCRVTCNFRVENSLKNSKSKPLSDILTSVNIDVKSSVQHVLTTKKIKPEENLVFIDRFTKSLTQICGYIDLIDIVEKKKNVAFSSENKEHEEKLLQLWSLLMPSTTLESRISSQWGEIGFQGKNPQTDFRGMGILGLENLLYFAKNQNDAARKVLSESHHPKYWYSYAIVGINITALSVDLLKSGDFKPHFYNITTEKPTLDDFHKVYCCLFREFSSFWLEQKPASVMEFNRIKDAFCKNLISSLQDPAAVLAVDAKCADVDTTSVKSFTSQDFD
ncbi:ELMO domain-containing protein 1-like [Dendronephthya gigantea]|uniref:ELMO domain-containing protein 1-like n=1 Tax=Dendronephthya gigantea TaxID=151771 RepID=UPI00106D6711|nr:ELMO domain-containing protein 1-like [Dendronephthya gigantea]XP_028404053.1 ELMO domain-containing protein 1-like [Dendronephthya gigantea]